MPTKEQELTSKNIFKFYDLSHELIDHAHNLTTDKQNAKNIEKFYLIMSFIDQFTKYTEILSSDYTKIIDSDEKAKKILIQDIQKQIMMMEIAIKNCQKKLKELNV